MSPVIKLNSSSSRMRHRAYLHKPGEKTHKCQNPQELWSYLWCQVLRGSTEGFHGSAVRDAFFTQPKVCYLYVAVLV